VALQLGTTELRVYVRPENEMRLSNLKAMAIRDLSNIARLAEQHQLRFVLEPHEVLKSHELVDIIETVNSPRVRLLFDFGNMVNAHEHPLEALQTMAPYITQVHAKDVKIVSAERGFQQVGVESGTGDLNLVKLIHDLLLLGSDAPQVQSIGLEEEVGYVSPPYRFAGEDEDPLIPSRAKSSTRVPSNSAELPRALAAELTNAHRQITTVREILARLNDLAAGALEDPG
jgi:hypothetical protein